MGNTLIDEPPPTLSDPPAGDRPTIDDIPPGERRGPSPTLPDVPPAAGQRRAAATILDSPPHAPPTPPAAPLYFAPAAPQSPPAAPHSPPATPQPAFVSPQPAPAAPQSPPASPQSPPASPQAPPATPQSAFASPQPAPAAPQPPGEPPPPPLTPRPQAAPVVGAPPPLAYPVPAGPPPGLLAQLPAMPAARPMPQPGLIVSAPGPAGTPAPAPIGAAPAAQPAPESIPSRDAAPPPEPAPAKAAAHAAAPARLPPGARTIVGVAPPPETSAEAHEGATSYVPPGQTSAPNPLALTQPAMSAQSPPAASAEASPPSGDAPAEDAAAAPQGARRSRARTWIAASIAVLGALAIAAVVLGYFLFFRYTPLAERHIPGASNVAVRADVRAIETFGPVRKHLWAALFDRPASKSAGKTFADRIADETGIRPAVDVREMIIASVDAKSWVLLVGGNFKPGRFVSGLEKVLRDEGYADWRRAGDMLVGPSGAAIGQADDGTIVLGTESGIVTAALPASQEYLRMDLPKTGALSFAVSKEAFEELSRSTGAFDPGGALRRIRHLKGTMALGDEPSVDIDIEPKGGESADTLGADVETFLSRMRLAMVLLPDQAGEKTAVSSAKVAVEQGHVRVRALWPLEGLDRGSDKLVSALGL